MTDPNKTPWLYAYLVSFVKLVFARRNWFIGAIVIISVACLGLFTQVILSTSFEGLFFGPNHEGYKQYKVRRAQFGGDAVILFAVEHDDPLNPKNLKKLKAVHEGLEALTDVSRVSSIANVARVRSVSGSIKTIVFADELIENPSQEKQREVFQLMRKDPAIKSLLLSSKAGHFVVLVELTNKKRAAEQAPALIDSMTKVFESVGYPRGQIHRAGFIATMAEIALQSRVNLTRLLPFVLLCLLLAVYLMFGKWWPVWVCTISALVAVIWSLGFAVIRDPHFSIMMTLVPCLILIISFSDVVHMCSSYFLELQQGKSKRQAIVDACADVGTACFLTSLTTCVGFMSMMFVPTPVFRRLGLTAGVGVCLAYLLAMTIVPIALDILPEPKDGWTEGRLSSVQRLLDRLLDNLAEFSIKRHWVLLAIFTSLFAVCVWGASRIHFETDLNQRLRSDNVIRVDERFFKANFGSTATVDIYVEVPETNGMLQPETFSKLVALENALETRDDVDKVVSIVDLMQTTHKAIVGEGEGALPFLPTTQPRLTQTIDLLQMQGVDALKPMIDFARRTVRMTVYTKQPGIRAQHEQTQVFAKIARDTIGDQVKITVQVLGLGALLGSWIDEIVNGQKRGVLVSMAIIALILVFGFGSLRMGFVSMLPNVLPLIAVGGFVGLAWETVDSDTLIVAMIAIGIGVDDTIHFVSRYQIERLKGANQIDGLRNTFRFSGRGIFMTTFIFTVGFLPLTLSAYTSIAIMGALLPYAFIMAVLADLFWVPALIRAGALDVPASQTQ